MIALAYLFAAAIYLWLTAKVCSWAWKKGSATGGPRRARLYAAGVVAVAYHLIFWDFIPVVALHSYYCHHDGGVTIHVSANQWLVANAGELTGLATPPNEGFSRRGESIKGWEGWEAVYPNRAIAALDKSEIAFPKILGIIRKRYIILDVRSNSILFEQIEYRAGRALIHETLRPQPDIRSCKTNEFIYFREIGKYQNLNTEDILENPNAGER